MTSSMTFRGASSSSYFTPPWTYDVFLSFRGEDIHNNFIAHLYDALHSKGNNTFMDDKLIRAEEISAELVKAIEVSRISIVVLSKNYASSPCCLDELMTILECRKTKKQLVLPVFYNIDPSDVRHQRKSVGEALAKLQDRFKDDTKVKMWKAALTKVANLSGWHLGNRNGSKFVNQIVQVVSRIVNRTYLYVAKHPVGVESRVQDVNSLLSIGMNDIRMVGIFGVGGIGKTTIAKAIYNLIAYQFEYSCFLANVRETSVRESGMVQLQEKLLFDILEVSSLKVVNVAWGINVIKDRLCCKRVLLVLDDVDQVVQLETLAGGCDWFGLGSRIIITTRDKHLLTKHKVDLTYKVKELDHDEALQLFSWNAFKSEKPKEDFMELTKHAIRYAGGLPLALTVLGSDLYGRDINHWKSALEKYKRIPEKNIQEKLKISYDGLEESEKNIFLDIACFFKGEHVEYVMKILDSCGFFPHIGIIVLMDKSLITIDESNGLVMHDLLQEMGREIVRQESPEEPGKRSRLWFHKDVRYVLEENMETNNVEGILVELPEQDLIRLSSKAFMKMKSLRLFINRNACFSGGPNNLPNELRLLDWPRYPLQSLPSNFHGKKLVAFRMCSSLFKELGKEFKNFQNLTVMDFSDCQFLTKIPDLSRNPNLEDLNLDNCTNLVEVHHSVGFLDKLAYLNLSGCSNLKSFPKSLKLRSLEELDLQGCSSLQNFPEIECKMECLTSIRLDYTAIKELPSSIGYLTGLHHLHLEGCKNLMNLPCSIFQLQHLKTLLLTDCLEVVELPKMERDKRLSMPSIQSSREYEISSSVDLLPLLPRTNSTISNDDCSSIAFPSLQFLVLDNCPLLKLDFLMMLNCFSTLSELDLSKTDIVSLPACINRFVRLNRLRLEYCKQLKEILELPPNVENVHAHGCMALESFPNVSEKFQFNTCDLQAPRWIDLSECHKLLVNIGNHVAKPLLEGYLKQHRFGIIFPGNSILDWFNHHKETSNSNSCEIDINGLLHSDEIRGIAICAVIGPIFAVTLEETLPLVSVKIISNGVQMSTGKRILFDLMGSEHVWLEYFILESFDIKADNLRVKFHSNSESVFFTSCGVHLVHKHRANAKNDDPRMLLEVGDVRLGVPDEEIENYVIGGTQLSKRRREDDDSHSESNWYPQLKRPSSTLGIRISDLEDTLLGESQLNQSNDSQH